MNTFSRPGRRLSGLLWLPFLFGLYLLLVDTFIWPELLAATGTALLGGGFALGLHHHDSFRVRLKSSWALTVLPLPARALSGLWAVTTLLGRLLLGRPGSSGRLTREPTQGTANSRLGAGYRAVLIVASSIPPDSVVLGVDRASGQVVVHRIDRRGGSALVHPRGKGP